MGIECEISQIASRGKEDTQKIIDCLKIYLQSMALHLKETKEQLDVLGFYSYEYNKKIGFVMEAKKQLYVKSK